MHFKIMEGRDKNPKCCEANPDCGGLKAQGRPCSVAWEGGGGAGKWHRPPPFPVKSPFHMKRSKPWSHTCLSPVSSSCGHFDVGVLYQQKGSHVAEASFSAPFLGTHSQPSVLNAGGLLLGSFPRYGPQSLVVEQLRVARKETGSC